MIEKSGLVQGLASAIPVLDGIAVSEGNVGSCDALSSRNVSEAWSEWLAFHEFHLLLTVTSANVTHPEAMLKRVRFLIAMINVHYYGKRYARHPHRCIQYVVAIERHKSGNPHAHALLRFPDELPAPFACRDWQDKFSATGGFCKLEIPRDQADVVKYCSKYVCKGGDLYLSDGFEPRRVQGVLQ